MNYQRSESRCYVNNPAWPFVFRNGFHLHKYNSAIWYLQPPTHSSMWKENPSCPEKREQMNWTALAFTLKEFVSVARGLCWQARNFEGRLRYRLGHCFLVASTDTNFGYKLVHFITCKNPPKYSSWSAVVYILNFNAFHTQTIAIYNNVESILYSGPEKYNSFSECFVSNCPKWIILVTM